MRSILDQKTWNKKIKYDQSPDRDQHTSTDNGRNRCSRGWSFVLHILSRPTRHTVGLWSCTTAEWAAWILEILHLSSLIAPQFGFNLEK
jgi:hypothetical protein